MQSVFLQKLGSFPFLNGALWTKIKAILSKIRSKLRDAQSYLCDMMCYSSLRRIHEN